MILVEIVVIRFHEHTRGEPCIEADVIGTFATYLYECFYNRNTWSLVRDNIGFAGMGQSW